MRVLGLGFPRTGTTSLRRALEILGVGSCHHMMVLNHEPHRVALWEAVADGVPGSVERALAGFDAAVDNPACSLWPALRRAFPQANVVLTVRDPHAWYASYMEAIHHNTFAPAAPHPPEVERMARLLRRVWLEGVLGGVPDDAPDHEARCVDAFVRHVEAVTSQVPDALVYEVEQGWEPLCELLGRPVPDLPFPHRNARTFVRTQGHREA